MNIVVIGADRGLGEVLSKMLAEHGHDVSAGCVDLAEGMQEEEGTLLRLKMDVTDEIGMKTAAEQVYAKKGPVDVVVHMAGVLLPSDRTDTLLTAPLPDIRRHLDVNAVGVLVGFRSFYPYMREGARFYAVTSEAGSFTQAGTCFPAYSVSKTAANKIVQTLRLTLAEMKDSRRVDVIAVHPGRMNTEMGRDTAEIEPEEAAAGFCRLIEVDITVHSNEHWFIDYMGRPMQV